MRAFTALAVRTLLCLCVSTLVQGKNDQTSSLELVATFLRQATGVSVHPPSGRIFVNFPRWTEDAPISVAEVFPPNTIVPFPPNTEWNSWRNTRKDELDPTKYFVCVQSVYAFGNSLFVLDPAAPGMNEIVSNGPKIVEIDLNTNQTKRTILIDETVVPRTSYMNDIRISPCGHWAYITDSGVVGALIIVNLKTGKAKRLLHGHPSTQADQTVTVKYHGVPIVGPSGNTVEATADGIAVSIDGATLYWQAIRGKNLYSIPTKALQAGLSDEELAAQIQFIGVNGPADGFWISSRQPDLLYVSSIEDDSIRVRNLSSNAYEVKLTDERLRWPDTFAEDEQGYIYVTASRIQDSASFKADGPIPLPTQLFRFRGN